MTEGELETRLNEKTVHPAGIENYGSWILIENLDKIIEDTKKELEGILSADMPDFQKLLAISAFKNELFGEK